MRTLPASDSQRHFKYIPLILSSALLFFQACASGSDSSSGDSHQVTDEACPVLGFSMEVGEQAAFDLVSDQLPTKAIRLEVTGKDDTYYYVNETVDGTSRSVKVRHENCKADASELSQASLYVLTSFPQKLIPSDKATCGTAGSDSSDSTVSCTALEVRREPEEDQTLTYQNQSIVVAKSGIQFWYSGARLAREVVLNVKGSNRPTVLSTLVSRKLLIPQSEQGSESVLIEVRRTSTL